MQCVWFGHRYWSQSVSNELFCSTRASVLNSSSWLPYTYSLLVQGNLLQLIRGWITVICVAQSERNTIWVHSFNRIGSSYGGGTSMYIDVKSETQNDEHENDRSTLFPWPVHVYFKWNNGNQNFEMEEESWFASRISWGFHISHLNRVLYIYIHILVYFYFDIHSDSDSALISLHSQYIKICCCFFFILILFKYL